MKDLSSSMSPWIYALGFFLRYISFSSADGVSTDELSLFNEDIDPLESTYLLSPKDPDLVSDVNLIIDDSDGLDMFPNDLGSDLFASGSDFNSIIDPTLVTDCSSIENSYLRKKARLRRETSCHNPYPNPSLTLPTLDQISPSEASKDPLQPQSPRQKKITNVLNEVFLQGGLILKTSDLIVKDCHSGERRVCSSDNGYNIQLEGNRGTYALSDSNACKWRYYQTLCPTHEWC